MYPRAALAAPQRAHRDPTAVYQHNRDQRLLGRTAPCLPWPAVRANREPNVRLLGAVPEVAGGAVETLQGPKHAQV